MAGLICYALTFITGILFLVLEKDNRFVRFHALQSILFGAFFFVANTVLSAIPFFGWILSLLLGLLGFVLWLFLMFKAFSGAMYKLPWLGDWAEKASRQLG